MRSYINPILLSIVLTYAGAETDSCCFPDRMEGELFIVEDQATRIFAIDYPAQRVMQKSYTNGEVMEILDLSSGLLYRFDEEGCRYSHGNPELFPQCLVGRRGDGQLLDIGESGNCVSLASYWTRLSGGHMHHLVSRRGRECDLFSVRTQTDTHVDTKYFAQIHHTITYTELYNSFENCTQNWPFG